MFNKKVQIKIIKVKLLKDVKHFSLWQLVIFVLIFAGVGGYAIYKSSATLLCCGGGGGAPPTAPTSLATDTFDDTEIDLSWGASTSSYGVSGYKIYRNGSLIATTTATSYYSTGLAAASRYSYYVVSYNSYGISAASNSASGITYSSTPPSVPLNFTARVISASTVNLNWNASTPGQVPIQEYDVYKFTPPDTTDASGQINGQFIASTKTNSYQVNGLAANTAYGFYVIAVDTSGNFSDQSYEALAKTNASGYAINVSLSASAYDVNNGQSLGLVWSSTPSGLTCTKILDSNSDGADPNWSGTVPSNVTGSQFLYPPNSSTDYLTYYYEISCSNGVSTAMSGVTVTVAPTPTTTSFETNLLNDLALSGETTTTASVVHLNGAYTDPLRGLRRWGPWAFRPWRIDQGVDYAGIGPVYAVGSGVVENYSNTAGWPTGHYISYKLTSGPAAGLWIYVAEVCRLNPHLHNGSTVTSSTVLCTMYKKRKSGRVLWGIETGWAARTLGSYSSANGGPCAGDGHSVYGRNFSHFMGAIKPQDAGAHRPPRYNCSGTLPMPPYHQWAP